jgi:hypothetical protein
LRRQLLANAAIVGLAPMTKSYDAGPRSGACGRGGAEEFAASIERQRAQIATNVKALGIQPTLGFGG